MGGFRIETCTMASILLVGWSKVKTLFGVTDRNQSFTKTSSQTASTRFKSRPRRNAVHIPAPIPSANSKERLSESPLVCLPSEFLTVSDASLGRVEGEAWAVFFWFRFASTPDVDSAPIVLFTSATSEQDASTRLQLSYHASTDELVLEVWGAATRGDRSPQTVLRSPMTIPLGTAWTMIGLEFGSGVGAAREPSIQLSVGGSALMASTAPLPGSIGDWFKFGERFPGTPLSTGARGTGDRPPMEFGTISVWRTSFSRTRRTWLLKASHPASIGPKSVSEAHSELTGRPGMAPVALWFCFEDSLTSSPNRVGISALHLSRDRFLTSSAIRVGPRS